MSQSAQSAPRLAEFDKLPHPPSDYTLGGFKDEKAVGRLRVDEWRALVLYHGFGYEHRSVEKATRQECLDILKRLFFSKSDSLSEDHLFAIGDVGPGTLPEEIRSTYNLPSYYLPEASARILLQPANHLYDRTIRKPKRNAPLAALIRTGQSTTQWSYADPNDVPNVAKPAVANGKILNLGRSSIQAVFDIAPDPPVGELTQSSVLSILDIAPEPPIHPPDDSKAPHTDAAAQTEPSLLLPATASTEEKNVRYSNETGGEIPEILLADATPEASGLTSGSHGSGPLHTGTPTGAQPEQVHNPSGEESETQLNDVESTPGPASQARHQNDDSANPASQSKKVEDQPADLSGTQHEGKSQGVSGSISEPTGVNQVTHRTQPVSIQEPKRKRAWELAENDLKKTINRWVLNILRPSGTYGEKISRDFARTVEDTQKELLTTQNAYSSVKLKRPNEWSGDSDRALIYDLRGRGPVWNNQSCAWDSLIVAAQLLRIDAVVVKNRLGDAVRRDRKCFLDLTLTDWSRLTMEESVKERDNFIDIYAEEYNQRHDRIYERGKAQPVGNLWEDITADFSEFSFQRRKVSENCRCSNQRPRYGIEKATSAIMLTLDQIKKLQEVVHGSGPVNLSMVLDEYFGTTTSPCNNCNSGNRTVFHGIVGGLPDILAVQLPSERLEFGNLTATVDFTYQTVSGDGDSPESTSRQATYRWLGGVFVRDLGNNNTHFSVFWDVQREGEEGKFTYYDGMRDGGMISGGHSVPGAPFEDRLPRVWTQMPPPLLFLERVRGSKEQNEAIEKLIANFSKEMIDIGTAIQGANFVPLFFDNREFGAARSEFGGMRRFEQQSPDRGQAAVASPAPPPPPPPATQPHQQPSPVVFVDPFPRPQNSAPDPQDNPMSPHTTYFNLRQESSGMLPRPTDRTQSGVSSSSFGRNENPFGFTRRTSDRTQSVISGNSFGNQDILFDSNTQSYVAENQFFRQSFPSTMPQSLPSASGACQDSSNLAYPQQRRATPSLPAIFQQTQSTANPFGTQSSSSSDFTQARGQSLFDDIPSLFDPEPTSDVVQQRRDPIHHQNTTRSSFSRQVGDDPVEHRAPQSEGRQSLPWAGPKGQKRPAANDGNGPGDNGNGGPPYPKRRRQP